MKRIFVIIGVFAVLLIILIVYLSRQRVSGTDSIKLSGTVEAVEIDLAFKTGGQIASISFDEGDNVAEGDTTAELTHNEIRAQIQLAEDRISAAQARLKSLKIEKESAERNLKKIANLVPAGGATQNQKEDLEDRIRVLEANIEGASSDIKSAGSQRDLLLENLKNEYLISPLTGKVLLRSAEPGEIARPGQTVLTVIDNRNLEIKVYIPEKYLGRVKIGQDVGIAIDSFEDKIFPGIVASIADKAEFTPKNIQTKEERVKTVYAVTVSSGNHGGILKPGMPCDVLIDFEPPL
ncbi:MAG: efflux RND transporter periplasmic adaptor subunit [Candidatus Zixiibacteriota bacterium]|nr:MAG: efflux RND transporter periplasmic adaptor subunit [candidate division Zixibacteria bacterium]